MSQMNWPSFQNMMDVEQPKENPDNAKATTEGEIRKLPTINISTFAPTATKEFVP